VLRAALAAVAAAGIVAGGAQPAAAAMLVPGGVHHPRVTCVPFKTFVTGGGYKVRNDTWDSEQCIRAGADGLTVTRSRPAHIYSAYPNIFYGCEAGLCTPGTVLPAPVDQVRHLTTGLAATVTGSGAWNVAYDTWLSRGPDPAETHPAAELMVWLTTRGLDSAAGWPVVTVGRRSYYVEHWTAHNAAEGISWEYIQFRRVHHTTSVTRLNLARFYQAAQRLGLLSRRYYLDAVEAGFEICRGGKGLAVTRFAVHARL
jgi:hypothetical protein